jgi:hypothetical protein
MKNAGILCMVCSLIVITAGIDNLNGQSDSPEYGKFGIGISSANLLDLLITSEYLMYSSSVYLPIGVTEKIRLEPEIGFAITRDERLYTLGLGLLGMTRFERSAGYAGLRAGTWNAEIHHVSLVLGCEYFLSERFSLGGEVQLRSLFVDRDLIVLTNSMLLIRFYFS